ncbi:hypothetical protein KIN20_008255, partial [Parelaphostrongylus tenuis]
AHVLRTRTKLVTNSIEQAKMSSSLSYDRPIHHPPSSEMERRTTCHPHSARREH